MIRVLRYPLFWGGLIVVAGVIHYFLANIIGLPLASVSALSLIITWIAPRPWRWLLLGALVTELIVITPPGAASAGILSPLVLWWLRGRVEVDVSFSYSVLVSASAALSLALMIGIATYPFWWHIPWLTVIFAWLSTSCIAISSTLLLPSLYSRIHHGRYF